MTHELIANMLGVRREGVTEAALKLQVAGLIRYTRGHISLLNRAALEERACECYAVVKKEYDRLIPDTLPALQMASNSGAGHPFHHRPFARVGLTVNQRQRD
jgi:hypothetical protein